MNVYADMDEVIDKWVRSADSHLYTEWAGSQARFFHLPGDPPFECFQISIQPPEKAATSVSARAIDTNDGTDSWMERVWHGPIDQLDDMLAIAFETIDTWKRRERIKPNTPSPL